MGPLDRRDIDHLAELLVTGLARSEAARAALEATSAAAVQAPTPEGDDPSAGAIEIGSAPSSPSTANLSTAQPEDR
jgi:hypothetical protein